jgi:hypothetical protein
VACPGCQVRLSDLPLDQLAAGQEYSCPHCTQQLRIPAPILSKLIAQRDAAVDSDFDKPVPSGPLARLWTSFLDAISWLWR